MADRSTAITNAAAAGSAAGGTRGGGSIGAGATAPVGEDRTELINRIYYQELGVLEADQSGLEYWLSRSDLDESQLRQAIREGAGLTGASVQEPLLADQSYAAFMRKMQFDESQIQSSLQAAQEAARRRIEGQAGNYDLQRTQATDGVNSSYEGRQNRSGNRLVDINDARTVVDRNQREFESGIAEANAQMETDAASSIASLRRSRAEEELAARDRLTQRSATI